MTMHIQSLKTLRNCLTSAVLREFAHPAIEPERDRDYELSEHDSVFYIRDSFAGDYRVLIQKLR